MSGEVMLVEHVFNGDVPEFTVRVWTPPEVWLMDDGRPGWVRFEVFEVGGVEGSGKPIYPTPGTLNVFDDPTEDLDEATRCAWGDVRPEGCVNYEVGTDDNVRLHACSSEELGFFLRAIQQGYDLAYSAMDEMERTGF